MDLMHCRQINPHSCLSYLLTDDGGKDAVLVDPVLEHLSDYTSALEKEGLRLAQVIDTHTHADHISAGAALKDMHDCTYVMHESAPAQCVDNRVKDGDALSLFSRDDAQVMHSPGHTNCSISLVFADRIFTGDALFLDDGGAGRDDLPGGDPAAHWETLERFRNLPEDLLVLPAHDYRNRKPSSLGQQKKTNPHLKPRTREQFVQYLEDLKLGPADWMKDVLKANYACARDPKAAWIPVDAPACEVKGTLEIGINEIQVQAITVKRLREALRSPEPPLLIDVREAHELTGPLGHIEGVRHVPIGDVISRLDELGAEKSRDMVIVCRSGSRAHTAAQIMIQAGFPRVQVLRGGMLAWNSPV
jgi:glyoxylase-like metal-dependent hydrolase (beta-lactamase superfamily II)/rhodanese-related sulfurtransferase